MTNCNFCKHSCWEHSANDFFYPVFSACSIGQELKAADCPGFVSVNATVRRIVAENIEKYKKAGRFAGE